MTDKPPNEPASDTKPPPAPKVPTTTQAVRAPVKDAGIIRVEDLPAVAILR